MNRRHSPPLPSTTPPLRCRYSGGGTVPEIISEQHSGSVLCPAIPMLLFIVASPLYMFMSVSFTYQLLFYFMLR